MPLAHPWAFEYGFFVAWLGMELTASLFHRDARDTRTAAIWCNDLARARGLKVPFKGVSLSALCKQLGVTNANPHDALADAAAEGEVYRRLLSLNDK